MSRQVMLAQHEREARVPFFAKSGQIAVALDLDKRPLLRELSIEQRTVTCVPQPQHSPHYDECLLPGPAEFAYVEVTSSECAGHWFADLDRFGAATCAHCRTWAWSPWWVRTGVYGADTALWIEARTTWAEHVMLTGEGSLFR